MACRPVHVPICENCLCCSQCQCLTGRQSQLSTDKTCRLMTNETACYQKLHATVDSHSFNRVPENMKRSCLQHVDAGKEAWQTLAYPHCERTCPTSAYCLEDSPSTLGRCIPHHDPRMLPYGLPPDSYDVKKRADWLSAYVNEAFRYF